MSSSRQSSKPCLTKNKVQVKVKVKAKAEATQNSTSTSTLAFIRMSIRCLVSDLSLTDSAGRVRFAARAGAGKARRAATAAALLLLGGARLLLGAPVTLDAVSPQPGQESFKHLWNITLHNPLPSTTSVYFQVEARDARAGTVFTAGTPPIALAPGDRQLSASDIKLTDVSCKKGYEAFIGPQTVLPEGDYTYIITLFPGPAQSAFFFRVRVPQPVELAWPPNGAAIVDSQPVLAWTPPVVSGPMVAYHYVLRVVEVGRGQNGLTAVRRNRPVFEGSRVPTATFRIPARTALAAGRTYAWRVTVTDTVGSPVDTARTRSQAGTFVYKPSRTQPQTHTSFTFPSEGHSVTGNASLVVASDVPDADLCVLEYSLGSDSASQDWHIIGSFPRAQGSFVGMWKSDSAVIRAGKTFPSPCFVRATVLGRKGQYGESALLSLVINPPPPPDRRGCGCRSDQDSVAAQRARSRQ